ncbi:life-span regulatory factor domain-containing protein [Purpureocillium lilacinum]|uniref:Life-span regulatory factor domain-containing protein n=1 Tax=Purpureocillium lilacinum TaxID=33203 RepID=A0A179GSS7_PURLI|nr:life-span regulatory factor domain-containing protein [Purpureocillium lilacinum]GJN74434.1 hypothetical protein PLICBS_008525 [Purpureocillium lilacinum]
MAFDLWTHQFCLACDKQVQSDGAYCSEACRLADQEKTSTPSSQASSPGCSPPSYGYPWSAPAPTMSARSTRPGLYLSPPYDFQNPQPYGTAPVARGYLSKYASGDRFTTTSSSASNLSPSSSHTSLCSMQSTSSSSTDGSRLSDRSRQELKAYAISFEQVRLQRRRSY